MDGASNGNGNGAAPEQYRITLPPELYAQLRDAAVENQRSISGEARFALTIYLRNVERRRQQQAAA